MNTKSTHNNLPVSFQPWPWLREMVKRHWIECLLLSITAYVLFNKEVMIELSFAAPGYEQAVGEEGANLAQTAGYVEAGKVSRSADHQHVEAENEYVNDAVDPAPHLNNLTFILSPSYARRKGIDEDIVAAKIGRVTHYVETYAPMAQAEMRAYGVPASITLAQGLLETNAGDSRLAKKSNNHFGIKCRSKCRGCTCRNYSDDSIYDMFRVFDNPADSFREHSLLLTSARYKSLKQHGTDYRKWAHGLKSKGYATDKNYATKLIQIIEYLELDRYDE